MILGGITSSDRLQIDQGRFEAIEILVLRLASLCLNHGELAGRAIIISPPMRIVGVVIFSHTGFWAKAVHEDSFHHHTDRPGLRLDFPTALRLVRDPLSAR